MNIYESIASCIADIGAVGKNSKNAQQGWMFRGIDAVYNAINPALSKNKVFIVPEILEMQREERTSSKGGALIYSIIRVKFTFYAEDGSNISCVVMGEGMDSGDKSINKAMSVAYKYACFQVFCIPTEEMKEADPDNETHEVEAKNKPHTETKKPDPDNETHEVEAKNKPHMETKKPATDKQIAVIRKIVADMGREVDEEWLKSCTLEKASEFIKQYSKKED